MNIKLIILSLSLSGCSNTSDIVSTTYTTDAGSTTYQTNINKSLCSKSEIAIATCTIDEKAQRVLSICSSADKKKVYYRFGVTKNIELEKLFTEKEPLIRVVDYNFVTYFQFINASYKYKIFVPQETYKAKVWIDIIDPNGNENSKECTTNSFEEKGLLSPVIKNVNEEEISLP